MYSEEAARLDAEILTCIERRNVPDFNALALRVFAHQLRYNVPYAQYCAQFGVTLERMPADWEAIPPVPSAAFKEAALCTFDPAKAELAFETSGTTQNVGGKHYMETARLYDASMLAGFHDAMLAGAPQKLQYLLLVPNPAERPQSSLGYMMRGVAAAFGDSREQWYLHGDTIDVERFVSDVKKARDEQRAVCLAGTAFAFVNLLDALDAASIAALPLAPGSRIMETGGFKGRTRVVGRDELYASLTHLFHIPAHAVIAEYGMTELTSQYYDRPVPGAAGPRVKHAPPWLRPRVVDAAGKTLPRGIVGALVHVDLANRSSALAIQTEDLGVATEDGGIILIGREQGAELRGCSLDAEQLRSLQSV